MQDSFVGDAHQCWGAILKCDGGAGCSRDFVKGRRHMSVNTLSFPDLHHLCPATAAAPS